MTDAELQIEKIRASTFVVEVLFCTGWTLQGNITWLEKEKTQSFRSLMELVALIQEGCTWSKSSTPESQLRSWFENSILMQGEQSG